MDGTINKPLEEIYMHTATGGKYYPFDPNPEHVDIEVIAHHLATLGRWAGATQHSVHRDRIFYSVAEHSVYCAMDVAIRQERPDLALCALLHDASEAYVGDLIRPLKYSAEFKAPFQRVEELNERVIAEAFGLPYPFPPEVKAADEAVCEAEYRQIIPRCAAEDWEVDLHDDSVCADVEIDMLPPHEAKAVFLRAYELITH